MHEKIKYLYEEKNIRCEDIGKEIGKSRKYIEKYVKDNNFIRKYKDKDWLVQQYFIEKKTQFEIAQLANCSLTAIRNSFKKFNIDITNQKNIFKYNYDQDYFEIIDTEDKAYWLGFLMADGCVHIDKNNKHTVSLNLSIKDEEHLNKLKNSIKLNKSLIYYQKQSPNSNRIYNYCTLKIHGKKFATNLINNGVCPNKTFNEKLPKIQKDLIRHFIRGYFDGDGSVGIYNRSNKKYCSITLIGSIALLEDIKTFANITHKIYKKRTSDLYYFSLTYNKAYNFLQWIYKDSTIYLDRKYDKYLEITKLIQKI